MLNQTEDTLFVFLTLPKHLHCKQIKLFLLKLKKIMIYCYSLP